MNIKMNRLQSRLGHVFQEPELLTQALTHRSGRLPPQRAPGNSWETPSLSLVIADDLFHRFPGGGGDLSRMRATPVREKTLAELGREFDLGSP